MIMSLEDGVHDLLERARSFTLIRAFRRLSLAVSDCGFFDRQ
jgi:hypothetical protein